MPGADVVDTKRVQLVERTWMVHFELEFASKKSYFLFK